MNCFSNVSAITTRYFSLTDSLFLALIGISIVLVVLGILMVLIIALTALVKKTEGKKFSIKAIFSKTKNIEDKIETPAILNNEVLATGRSGSVKLHTVHPRTAALIMAIVADETKTPLNELNFISIKEVMEDNANEIQG